MSTSSETPIPANEHRMTLERVLTIAQWLVEGKVRPQCVALAVKEWEVSRRTAQVYVARAAARIVRATADKDPLFALKLGRIQRDRLLSQLEKLMREGEIMPLPHWQMKVKTIQTMLKVLDSRDRMAAKVQQMEASAPPRTTPVPTPQQVTETLRPTPPPAPAQMKPQEPVSSPGPEAAVPRVDETPRRQPKPAQARHSANPARPEDIAIVPVARKDKQAKQLRSDWELDS